MKSLKILSVLLFAFGCQKATEQHPTMGVWSHCSKEGHYFEYKITEDYVMFLSAESEEILLFKNKLIHNGFILSEYENGARILLNNDTLVVVSETDHKIVLKSTYTNDSLEFDKVEFDIDEIDSLDVKSWEQKTRSQFKKRAELANCRDVRTEEEKVVPTLEIDDTEEVEQPTVISEQ